MPKKRDNQSRAAQTKVPPAAPGSKIDTGVLLAILGVVVLALVAYANAIDNQFALDDIGAILENPIVRGPFRLGTIFTSNYWSAGPGTVSIDDAGLYRPLTVLSFVLDYRLFGVAPMGYHVVNVIAHVLASIALLFVGLRLFRAPALAFVAAAIFAAHPIHTEAVTGIVGRAEVLAGVFFFGAVWVAAGAKDETPEWGRSLGVAVLYLLGLFAKETAVTLPAVLLLWDWMRRPERDGPFLRRGTIVRYAMLGVALLVYLSLRQNAVGARLIWPGWEGVGTGARLLTASRVLLEYLILFVFPKTLLAEYWTGVVPIAHSPFAPMVLLALALWIAIGVYIVRTRRDDRLGVFVIAWFFVTMLPISNLLFPVGVAKAERLLYLPSAGLCLVCAWAYARAARRVPVQVSAVALAGVLLALTGRTIVRNRDWKNNATLTAATLAHSPRSPLMNDMAGHELALTGDYEKAIPYYRRALESAPDAPLIRAHLGESLLGKGDTAAATDEFQRAARANPNDAQVHGNLGMIYFQRRDYDSAMRELEFSSRLNPNEPKTFVALGLVYAAVGRGVDAERAFFRSIQLDPKLSEARINLGVLYLHQRRLADALRILAEAVELDPMNPEARNDLGYVIELHGDKRAAAQQYRAALRLRTDYATAKANLDRVMARPTAPQN
jgi:Flp pilus assembly protein TadD